MDDKKEDSFLKFFANECMEREKIKNSYQRHKEVVDIVKEEQLDFIAKKSSERNKSIDENIDLLEDALAGGDPDRIKESLKKLV